MALREQARTITLNGIDALLSMGPPPGLTPEERQAWYDGADMYLSQIEREVGADLLDPDWWKREGTIENDYHDIRLGN
jgi:hypothetical protein